VTSKLRLSLAIAADSAISEDPCKSHRALNATGRQIVLREETVALIVLGRITRDSQENSVLHSIEICLRGDCRLF